MNTFLLKIGCLVLFGFIFFVSFQADQSNTNQLSSKENFVKENIEQQAVVITANAINSSVAHYETVQGYENNLFDN